MNLEYDSVFEHVIVMDLFVFIRGANVKTELTGFWSTVVNRMSVDLSSMFRYCLVRGRRKSIGRLFLYFYTVHSL